MIYNLLLRLYNLIFSIIAIFSIFWLSGKNKEKFRQRLCLNKVLQDNSKYIWLHGASVGEVLSAQALVNGLLKKYPECKIIITSHTKTSQNLIAKNFDNRVLHQYLPWDCNYLVKKFLKRYNPVLVLWMEQDFFPIFLANINKKQIPLLLLNARMSNTSFRRWKKLKFIIGRILGYFNVIYPMSLNHKKKLDKLGAKNTKFLGNLKYTNIANREEIVNKFSSEKAVLNNYLQDSPVFVALSTHKTEEDMIARIHLKLKDSGINLKTIIIPRHVERIEDILKNFAKNGVQSTLFSEISNNPADILMVDSMGIAGIFCAVADITFMGKSLYLKGGHNLLEPLAVGSPVIFGKHMGNFKDIVFDTLNHKAGIRVIDENDLYNKLLGVFSNKEYLSQLKANTNFLAQDKQRILINFMSEVACYLKI
ncbi:MAG: hypothetical protein LBQ34_00795 [Alphaproteobacteria bacterium]|nr:hypothetical protein [Alphaproteobacteria bacterium]